MVVKWWKIKSAVSKMYCLFCGAVIDWQHVQGVAYAPGPLE